MRQLPKRGLQAGGLQVPLEENELSGHDSLSLVNSGPRLLKEAEVYIYNICRVFRSCSSSSCKMNP